MICVDIAYHTVSKILSYIIHSFNIIIIFIYHQNDGDDDYNDRWMGTTGLDHLLHRGEVSLRGGGKGGLPIVYLLLLLHNYHDYLLFYHFSPLSSSASLSSSSSYLSWSSVICQSVCLSVVRLITRDHLSPLKWCIDQMKISTTLCHGYMLLNNDMITIHCVVNKDKDTYIRDSMRISVLAYEAI